jgi:hypothetical protein
MDGSVRDLLSKRALASLEHLHGASANVFDGKLERAPGGLQNRGGFLVIHELSSAKTSVLAEEQVGDPEG